VEQWQIRNDPVTAIGQWPDLAAEFDRRWTAEHGPDGSENWPADTTFGDQMKAADALAAEILTTHGHIKTK
jgi:hypothetical protein